MSEQGAAKRVHFQRHEDDEFYDAVTINLEERWKESEVSGDEWRFSYVARFWRKGEMVGETWAGHTLRDAMAALTVRSWKAREGDERSAEEIRAAREADKEKCFQPGCPDLAVVEYRKKKDWCNRCGGDKEITYGEHHRRFCERHKSRGDCGLDDADHNYELVAVRGEDGEWQAQ